MAGEGEEADGKADTAWIARVKEEEKREMTKTEIDLRGYMSNLIKESIRVSPSWSFGIEWEAENRLHTSRSLRWPSSEEIQLLHSRHTAAQGNTRQVQIITWSKV